MAATHKYQLLSQVALMLLLGGFTLPLSVDTSFQLSAPQKRFFSKRAVCEYLMTAEKGSIQVISGITALQDCTYLIHPFTVSGGAGQIFKLWVDDINLETGDLIEVRDSPSRGPLAQSAGPTHAGLFLTLTSERYVRVRAVNSTTHRALLHWAPVRVDTVTSLSCSADGMSVSVNLTELRWLYSDTDPRLVALTDDGCTGTSVGNVLVLNTSHNQCYTERQINASHVTYRNALVYKEGQGPVIREHRWKVDLECHFRRHMEVGLEYQVQDTTNYVVNLQSDYRAHINLYNDSTLRSELTQDNVKAQLGTDLYVAVVLEGQWNVSMHLRQCVARPAPGASLNYTLIQDGCAVDSETYIMYSTHNNTLFHFKAFEFYAGYSAVYIYCDVTFCTPQDNSQRCASDCH